MDMHWIDAMPIRWKLVLGSVLTSAFALALATVVLAAYENRVYRTQRAQELATEAQIVASSLASSLVFDDDKAAQGYLDGLRSNPQIEAAAAYRSDGRMLAQYVGSGAPPPQAPRSAGTAFLSDTFEIFEPVVENNQKAGMIYLRTGTTPMSSRLARYAGGMLLATIASLGLAVPIAMRLGATIHRPIAKVASAASQIAAGDLGVEIDVPRRNDEIGTLTASFARMVASLREMTGTLERRVAERTTALEAANKELEAFAYSVSHDLRAPLRAIDGYSRMLEEDLADTLDDESRRLLSVVRSNSRKMGQLIDDLLTFSKFGRQSMNQAEVDMTGLARSVWTELNQEGGSCVFELQDLPKIQGDSALLKQVWINLLSNAHKYSGTRDAPVVEVSGETDGEAVTYRVKDNGVGFDMRYYDKLFGVFQRLHSAEEFPGTGVGLAIVQRVISRHGGRVWAESELGAGTTFFFKLPVAAR